MSIFYRLFSFWNFVPPAVPKLCFTNFLPSFRLQKSFTGLRDGFEEHSLAYCCQWRRTQRHRNEMWWWLRCGSHDGNADGSVGAALRQNRLQSSRGRHTTVHSLSGCWLPAGLDWRASHRFWGAYTGTSSNPSQFSSGERSKPFFNNQALSVVSSHEWMRPCCIVGTFSNSGNLRKVFFLPFHNYPSTRLLNVKLSGERIEHSESRSWKTDNRLVQAPPFYCRPDTNSDLQLFQWNLDQALCRSEISGKLQDSRRQPAKAAPSMQGKPRFKPSKPKKRVKEAQGRQRKPLLCKQRRCGQESKQFASSRPRAGGVLHTVSETSVFTTVRSHPLRRHANFHSSLSI